MTHACVVVDEIGVFYDIRQVALVPFVLEGLVHGLQCWLILRIGGLPIEDYVSFLLDLLIIERRGERARSLSVTFEEVVLRTVYSVMVKL